MSMWRHWKLVLGLLAVFLAGTLVGGVVAIRSIQRQFHDKMNSANWSPRSIAWLKQELKLNEQQLAAVQKPVDDAVVELIELRDNAEKQRKAILGKMLTTIAVDLDEAQRKRLGELVQEAIAKTTKSPGVSMVP